MATATKTKTAKKAKAAPKAKTEEAKKKPAKKAAPAKKKPAAKAKAPAKKAAAKKTETKKAGTKKKAAPKKTETKKKTEKKSTAKSATAKKPAAKKKTESKKQASTTESSAAAPVSPEQMAAAQTSNLPQKKEKPKREFIPKSTLQEVVWPAVPNNNDALVLSLIHQFQQCENWSPIAIQSLQLTQALILLKHASRTTQFYKNRLTGLFHKMKDGPLNWNLWRTIPILEREDLQKAGARIFSKKVPERHGKVSQIRTSGSTGKAVTIRGTAVTGAFFQAYNLRYHLWHNRDFSKHTGAIRVLSDEAAKRPANQGVPWVPCYQSAPMFLCDIRKPVRQQVEWLKQAKPHMLLTYPSNLEALLGEIRKQGVKIENLHEVSTFGENVSPRLRQKCMEVLGAKLTDVYSCQEMGVMAIQAPDCAPGQEYYLVMSENVILEILDDDGNPCPAGVPGRVVVTDLHNFATPLIRYAIGDHAMFGPPCPKGRGLPVIHRILGRSRNMMLTPDGDHVWPRFNSDDLTQYAPVSQVQIVQKAVNELQANLVVTRKPTPQEEKALVTAISENLPGKPNVTLKYVDDIPLSANGKFEDFKSEIEES